MVKWILKKIVGSKHQKELKKLKATVEKINQLEVEFQSLSDDQLREKTASWKDHLKSFEVELDQEIDSWKNQELQGISKNDHQASRDIEEQARHRKNDRIDSVHQMQDAYLTQILPQAYAVVKNGARRMVGLSYSVCDQPMSWDMIHFDCQLYGGIGLHRGMIAEMATGEGKTLVSTCPLYLNALSGKNCQLVTVNDYLVSLYRYNLSSIFINEIFHPRAKNPCC